MLDGIPVTIFDNLDDVALLVGLFWMLATGRLITRRENDATVADRNMWRETAQTLTPVVTKVLTEAETTNRLLRALPNVPDEGEPR